MFRIIVLQPMHAHAGDIIFYDKKASGTCRQMGAVRCPSVTAEWSPDGRSLLTATTAPRLRVDNALRVFTYYGEWWVVCGHAQLLAELVA